MKSGSVEALQVLWDKTLEEKDLFGQAEMLGEIQEQLLSRANTHFERGRVNIISKAQAEALPEESYLATLSLRPWYGRPAVIRGVTWCTSWHTKRHDIHFFILVPKLRDRQCPAYLQHRHLRCAQPPVCLDWSTFKPYMPGSKEVML